jgi:hypothetical protein
MAAYLTARSDPVVSFLERFLDVLQNRFGAASMRFNLDRTLRSSVSDEWNRLRQSGSANEKLGLL